MGREEGSKEEWKEEGWLMEESNEGSKEERNEVLESEEGRN